MRLTAPILFLLSIIAGNCRHDPSTGQFCSTPDQVSFSQDIQPIFNTFCITPDCHSGNAPQGNLNLEPGQSYAELNNPGSGYIDTLNPKISLLYAQMRSTSDPMPPTGKLDDCTTELILRWIEQKAKNN